MPLISFYRFTFHSLLFVMPHFHICLILNVLHFHSLWNTQWIWYNFQHCLCGTPNSYGSYFHCYSYPSVYFTLHVHICVLLTGVSFSVSTSVCCFYFMHSLSWILLTTVRSSTVLVWLLNRKVIRTSHNVALLSILVLFSGVVTLPKSGPYLGLAHKCCNPHKVCHRDKLLDHSKVNVMQPTSVLSLCVYLLTKSVSCDREASVQ